MSQQPTSIRLIPRFKTRKRLLKAAVGLYELESTAHLVARSEAFGHDMDAPSPKPIAERMRIDQEQVLRFRKATGQIRPGRKIPNRIQKRLDQAAARKAAAEAAKPGESEAEGAG